MGKYATGKKAIAISDRSGFKIKYNDLKTTWDGLRVEKEEWEPKHPQLTPAKNVFDATALFNPRPDNDSENVSIFIGFNYDPFIDQRLRPPVGVNAIGGVGLVSLAIDLTETGVAGTGAVGTESIELSINEAGVAGTGAAGTFSPTGVKGVSGSAGTGAVGVEALSLSIDEAGVAGTGAVGAELVELSINESGVSGTGAVGNESAVVDESFWGSGSWGSGTWGN